MSFTGLLTHSADVYTLTTTAGTYGDWTPASTARLAGVPCRIRTLSSAEREIAFREGVETTHRVYFDGNVSIYTTDQLTISGKTYKVQSVEDPDEQGRFLQVDVRRLS